MSCRWLGLCDWKFGRGKRVGSSLESTEVTQAFRERRAGRDRLREQCLGRERENFQRGPLASKCYRDAMADQD